MLGHRRALAVLVLILPVAAVLAAPAAGKWVRLFNGDLAGRKPHGAERWIVDKGEILGETLTKEYGYLSTERTYRDFELKVKFKAEGAGNSGIFFHSSLDGVDIKGVQAEVDPRAGMHRPRRRRCVSAAGTTCVSWCAGRTSGPGSTASRRWTMSTRPRSTPMA